MITIDEARREFTKSMELKLLDTEDEEALAEARWRQPRTEAVQGPCPVFSASSRREWQASGAETQRRVPCEPRGVEVEELEMLVGAGSGDLLSVIAFSSRHTRAPLLSHDIQRSEAYYFEDIHEFGSEMRAYRARSICTA